MRGGGDDKASIDPIRAGIDADRATIRAALDEPSRVMNA